MKNTILIFLIVFSLIFVSGCSSSLHGDIKFAPDKKDNAIIYKGTTYREFDEKEINLTTTENDIELGYQNTVKGYRGFFSENSDAPDYIFVSRGVGDYAMTVYISEDYDYKSKRLVVGNTDDKVLFSDAFVKINSDLEPKDYLDSFEISLYFEDCPRLEIHEDIFFAQGVYYCIHSGQRYALTDELLDILRKNKII